MSTDCLLIGYNDSNFAHHVDLVRSMGESSGAYRDLNLAFVEHQGQPFRCMDLINHFYPANHEKPLARPLSNCDFLWPTITYLGTYLHRRGYTFDYVNLFQLEKDKLREKLLHDDVLTVGITTTLYVAPYPILEIVSFIREHNPEVKIVVGGPYVSNQAKMMEPAQLDELFGAIGADFYVISNEGEQCLAQLLEALKSRGDLAKVPNLAYRNGSGYTLTAAVTERSSLEENMVDYSLFPAAEIGELVSLRTAKSCPFSCAFCGFPQRAGEYTYLDVGLVEAELNRLAELGSVTTLTFLDDTFNVPKRRFKELLRMMIRNQYGFKWNSYYRSDHGDEEAIELMAEAGCEGVFLGVESGSDEMLKRMNKTARRKDYLTAIPLLRGAGISTYASLIVGFPGETYQTVEETVDLIEQARPTFYRAQLWYCDPATPIWNRREEHGVRGSAFSWSHDTMDVRTACDIIDEILLYVDGSTWMPQYGFEQWSTFYLQRKGMSRERVNAVVRAFDEMVKEKVRDPSRREPGPALLEQLADSCRFDGVGALAEVLS